MLILDPPFIVTTLRTLIFAIINFQEFQEFGENSKKFKNIPDREIRENNLRKSFIFINIHLSSKKHLRVALRILKKNLKTPYRKN